MTALNIRRPGWLGRLFLWACLGCLSCLSFACSESDDEAADDYADWQQRNEAFFATLEDSLSRGADHWQKLKTYTKDPLTAGKATDYVYVKVLTQGEGTVCPLYSDSVRVSYRGRLIPTATYAEGYVFDQTYVGSYSVQTTGVSDNVVSSFVDGFATALQHMHTGDRWRVYIPYQLGYGTAASGSIPAYSTLIFDVALIDFVGASDDLDPWTCRQL